MPFLNKALSKEIKKLTKLWNKILNDSMEENKKGMPHGEINVLLLQKTKKRIFWQSIQLFWQS